MSKCLSFGGGDYALFDLLVEVALERSLPSSKAPSLRACANAPSPSPPLRSPASRPPARAAGRLARRQDGGSQCGRLAEDGSPHHAAVTMEDIQRAVEELKQTVRTAKREIIKDAHTARTSEVDRRVPTGERARQIGNVRKIVRETRAAGKRMSILRACRKAWQDVKGGYPSPEALYDYCHSHRTEF